MIKRFITWLKGIYFKPAAAEKQTSGVTEMSEQSVIEQQPAIIIGADSEIGSVPVSIPQPAITPLEAEKAKFARFVEFVEHGLEVLGKDAEADLVALKEKYL